MEQRPITALLAGVAQGAEGADERLAGAVLERLESIAEREMLRRGDGCLDGFTLEPRVFADDALLQVLEGAPALPDRPLPNPPAARQRGNGPGLRG